MHNMMAAVCVCLCVVFQRWMEKSVGDLSVCSKAWLQRRGLLFRETAVVSRETWESRGVVF